MYREYIIPPKYKGQVYEGTNKVTPSDIERLKIRRIRFDMRIKQFVKKLQISNSKSELRTRHKTPDFYVDYATRIRERSENKKS
jgi:hypothetical protein